MALGVNQLTAGQSNTFGLIFDTLSISPTPNAAVILHVVAHTNNQITDPVITGNGITYAKIFGGQYFNGGYNNLFYRGMSAAPTPGPVRLQWAEDNQDLVGWQIVEFPGADATGANGSSAIANGIAGSVVGTSVTMDTGASPASGNAIIAGLYVHADAATFTPQSGFTVYGTQSGFNDAATTIAVQYSLAPTLSTITCTHNQSAATTGVWGFHILAAAAAGGLTAAQVDRGRTVQRGVARGR